MVARGDESDSSSQALAAIKSGSGVDLRVFSARASVCGCVCVSLAAVVDARGNGLCVLCTVCRMIARAPWQTFNRANFAFIRVAA